MKQRSPRALFFILMVAAVLWLAACGQERPAAVGAGAALGQEAPATATATVATVVPATATSPPPTAQPTETPTSTATATATETSTPTVTSTPSATPTPTHPLMIDVMRQQAYPGSELTYEATLTWGPGFERFIVSYLSEGHKIYALLTVPLSEKPEEGWPVIIFNHGYIPPDQYRTTERYEAHVEALASHGYVVLRPDYRGHGNSEGRAEGGYGSPAYTVDVLNALAAVKTHPDIDPNRIGMWGHSMGGQITLRAMVVSDEIKAGVIWAGVVGSYPDLLQHWRRRTGPTSTPDATRLARGSWRRDLTEVYGGPEENPVFWASISPNSYLSEISGPLQLHHGTADESVPVILSELLAEEMQAAGQYVDLWVWEDDNHNLTINWGFIMERTIQFFDRFVKGTG